MSKKIIITDAQARNYLLMQGQAVTPATIGEARQLLEARQRLPKSRSGNRFGLSGLANNFQAVSTECSETLSTQARAVVYVVATSNDGSQREHHNEK